MLEEIAGISSGVLGEKNLARAVRERMSACKLSDEEQYFDKARSSSCEMESLIEAVAVSETSFFRDKGPFTFLGRYVREEWARAPQAGLLRILSAPCSSGEEPYSIAIMLHETGLKSDEYQIDALDISRALLSKAERAVYTPHSFRGVADSLRSRYFTPVGREYALDDALRQGVHFIHGNLLDKRVLAGRGPYDVIFCRNLLIYFGTEARARLIHTIDRLLAERGLLFVGHAETSCFPTAKFQPLDHRGTFGFRKVELAATAIEAGSAKSFDDVSPAPPVPVRAKAHEHEKAKQPPAAAPDVPKTGDSFQMAQQLADQGRLQEAATICERLLLADGANANTYCLLGAVQHGLGNLKRAEECFTRAIYLDGRCYDAIVHLSLIKEHRGDKSGAEVLRRRAARIQAQKETS